MSRLLRTSRFGAPLTAGTAHERRWMALALVASTQFVVVLDMTIVNVALPAIGADLDVSQASLTWVVNAYLLAFGGFLLLGGRAADLLARRRMFMIGLALFGLASLADGLAQTEGPLIAARALQGLGGAIASPAALSIVAATFKEGSERNRALGIWGAVAGSGAAAGVLLGGVLTDGLGWQWDFWVNVPIALAGAVIAPALVAESRDDRTARGFDAAGAITVTAGLSLLVYALVEAESAGWGSTRAIALVAAAAALLAIFVTVELRSKAPLVPFESFKQRAVRAANAAMLIFAAGMFAMMFFLTLYMQQVLGYGPLETGLAFLPMPLAILISTQVASRLATRIGVKPVLVTGLALAGCGLAWLAQISPAGSFAGDLLGPAVLTSIGGGMAFVTLTITAVTGVPERDSGFAAGLINTSQQVGSALGLASLATLASSRTEALAGAAPINGVALTEGFRAGLLGGAALAFLAALTSLLLIPSDPRPEPVGEAVEAGGTS